MFLNSFDENLGKCSTLRLPVHKNPRKHYELRVEVPLMPDVPTVMSWTLNVTVVTSNHGQDKCHYPGMTIYVNDTKKPDVFIACPRKDSVGDCVFHCSGYTPGQWDGPRLFVRLEIPITGHWHMPETVCEIITEWEPEIRNYVSDSWTSIDQNTVTMIYGVQLIWLKKPILTLHDLWTSHFVHRLNKVHSEFRVLLFHLCHNYMMTSSNGNIFCVTAPLCEEFTGHRWIPRTKASDAELWCFLWYEPE